MPRITIILLLSFGLVLTVACGSTSGGVSVGSGERFQGRIASTGPAAGATAYLTLQIDRYADDAEIAELAKVLAEGGQDAMVKAIAAKEPAGWMRIGSGLRYYLRVIRSVNTADGGRVLVALTDRTIHFGEVVRSSRSQNYPIGMVDLTLDSSDTGNGRLIPAAQVRFSDGTAEMVSYGTQPFVLLNVEKLR